MPWQPVPVAKHQVEARRFSRLSLPVSSLLQITGYSPVHRTVLVSMYEQVLLARCHGSWRPQLFKPNRTKDTLTFSNQVAEASKRKRKQSRAGLAEECLHRIPRGVTLSSERKSNSLSKMRRKLQALVYDILPWRKVTENDARSVVATL